MFLQQRLPLLIVFTGSRNLGTVHFLECSQLVCQTSGLGNGLSSRLMRSWQCTAPLLHNACLASCLAAKRTLRSPPRLPPLAVWSSPCAHAGQIKASHPNISVKRSESKSHPGCFWHLLLVKAVGRPKEFLARCFGEEPHVVSLTLDATELFCEVRAAKFGMDDVT